MLCIWFSIKTAHQAGCCHFLFSHLEVFLCGTVTQAGCFRAQGGWVVGLGAVTWGQVVTPQPANTCMVGITVASAAVWQPLRASFFLNQCLCAGWNSSGKAFGMDVMQYIYVAEDRRDFNSQVDKMILSSGITVPVLFFFNYQNWGSVFNWMLIDTGLWLVATTFWKCTFLCFL